MECSLAKPLCADEVDGAPKLFSFFSIQISKKTFLSNLQFLPYSGQSSDKPHGLPYWSRHMDVVL